MKVTREALVKESQLAVVAVIAEILVENKLITREALNERVKEMILKMVETDFNL